MIYSLCSFKSADENNSEPWSTPQVAEYIKFEPRNLDAKVAEAIEKTGYGGDPCIYCFFFFELRKADYGNDLSSVLMALEAALAAIDAVPSWIVETPDTVQVAWDLSNTVDFFRPYKEDGTLWYPWFTYETCERNQERLARMLQLFGLPFDHEGMFKPIELLLPNPRYVGRCSQCGQASCECPPLLGLRPIRNLVSAIKKAGFGNFHLFKGFEVKGDRLREIFVSLGNVDEQLQGFHEVIGECSLTFRRDGDKKNNPVRVRMPKEDVLKLRKFKSWEHSRFIPVSDCGHGDFLKRASTGAEWFRHEKLKPAAAAKKPDNSTNGAAGDPKVSTSNDASRPANGYANRAQA
jgi:hypothetical protein